MVEVESLADLRLLLGSLAGVRGSGLRSLELRFLTVQDAEAMPPSMGASYPECCYRLPKELEQLTSLTELSIQQLFEDYPKNCLLAADLSRLSTLTALQTLSFGGVLGGAPPPPGVIGILQQLTGLDLKVIPGNVDLRLDWAAPWNNLASQHLPRCTGLQRLYLNSVDPVPPLSEQQALAAWQHLEELQLFLEDPRSSPTAHGGAGFWRALPQLPCLTRLACNGVQGQPSRVLRNGLPARLVTLQLWGYSEPAPPPLPPSLTKLELLVATPPDVLPVSASLRDLTLASCGIPVPEWPAAATIMTQLTGLRLMSCPLGEQLPAPLAALPALQVLDLRYTQLADLPNDLACLSCLRSLSLGRNRLSRVPAVLGGGAASRLEHLDLMHNDSLAVDDEGLAVLCSLSALTCLKLLGAAQGVEPADAGSAVLRSALLAGQALQHLNAFLF